MMGGMGFNAPAGMRGIRQPRARLMMRWVTKMAARRIRRTGTMMGLGFSALVLTTVGAKGGAERTNPVVWFPGTDGSWLIVASAAGAAREPGLASQHRRASRSGENRLGGRTIPVTAEQLHGAEREQAWRQITAAASRFAACQPKTDRELPIIRRTPQSG
jgi:deazaflavin-dependent oxidoreductase (nitroreductase family)